MKKVLKIIVILMLVIILVTGTNISVNAEDSEENIKVTLQTKEDVQLVKGNTIEIVIDLQLLNDKQVNGLQLLIEYDEKVLKLNEEESFMTTRETRWDYPTTSNYEGQIGFLTTRNSSRGGLSGEVCNMVFEVLETTDSTNIEIKEGYCSFVQELMLVENYILTIETETPDKTPDENPDEIPDEIPDKTPDQNPDEKLYLSTEENKIGDTNIKNYEDGDKYISRIEKETTKAGLIEKLKTNGEIRIIKQDGTELEEDELVGTGMTIEVTKDEEKIELKIAVAGDLDGDGKVTATDLSTLSQTIQKLVTLEDEYYIAADLDENSNITATDLSTINKFILRLI